MIDLDELISGNPSWDQVIEFWRDDGDFCGEEYLVQAIEIHLLTESQRKLMFDNRLTIEKMLNGRYSHAGATVQQIFNEWNTKLGFEAFGG